jgi:hypothetical protein
LKGEEGLWLKIEIEMNFNPYDFIMIIGYRGMIPGGYIIQMKGEKVIRERSKEFR